MNMSKQKIFDKVVTHLATQKKKAYFDGGCVYRSPDGLKCAIGCLISDKLYNPTMEGNSIDTIGFSKYNLPQWFKKNRELLFDLQRAHDNCSNVNDIRYELRSIARSYVLDSKLVKNIKKWS